MSLGNLLEEIETKLKTKGILKNKWEYMENPNVLYTFNSQNDTKVSFDNSNLNKSFLDKFSDDFKSQFSEFQKEIRDNLNSMNNQIEHIKKSNSDIYDLKRKIYEDSMEINNLKYQIENLKKENFTKNEIILNNLKLFEDRLNQIEKNKKNEENFDYNDLNSKIEQIINNENKMNNSIKNEIKNYENYNVKLKDLENKLSALMNEKDTQLFNIFLEFKQKTNEKFNIIFGQLGFNDDEINLINKKAEKNYEEKINKIENLNKKFKLEFENINNELSKLKNNNNNNLNFIEKSLNENNEKILNLWKENYNKLINDVNSRDLTNEKIIEKIIENIQTNFNKINEIKNEIDNHENNFEIIQENFDILNPFMNSTNKKIILMHEINNDLTNNFNNLKIEMQNVIDDDSKWKTEFRDNIEKAMNEINLNNENLIRQSHEFLINQIENRISNNNQ